jgi:hypothetical protein
MGLIHSIDGVFISSHSVSLTQSFLLIIFHYPGHAHALPGPSPPGINCVESLETWPKQSRGETYHADVVAVEQELRKLDLGTGVVAVSRLVSARELWRSLNIKKRDHEDRGRGC